MALFCRSDRVPAVRNRKGQAGAGLFPVERRLEPLGQRHHSRPCVGYGEIDADRYFSPNPNHANQFEFSIAMPQTVGFSNGSKAGSDADFRPERITGIFAPPPLFWPSISTRPGPASGSAPSRANISFPPSNTPDPVMPGRRSMSITWGTKPIDGEFLAGDGVHVRLRSAGRAGRLYGVAGQKRLLHACHGARCLLAPSAGLLRVGGADRGIDSLRRSLPTSWPPRPTTKNGFRFSNSAVCRWGRSWWTTSGSRATEPLRSIRRNGPT